MNTNLLLGKRIKLLRNIKKFSKKEIAEKLNITEEKYISIENGFTNISLETLRQIADVLNIRISDITNVLNNEIKNEQGDNNSIQKIFNMLDLFYANKHLYERLKNNN